MVMDEDRHKALSDPKRLSALYRTGLLDSPAEAAFDRFTRLASRILAAPVALISLVDQDRQFFKSGVGLREPWRSLRQTPLTHSFCAIVVETLLPLLVSDARTDPRVQGNLAIEELGVVAYLGIPLIALNGDALGALCVIDGVPRKWSQDDLELLDDLAAATVTEIELRVELTERQAAQAHLRRSKAEVRNLADAMPQIVWSAGPTGRLESLNRRWEQFTGIDAVVGLKWSSWRRVMHPDDFSKVFAAAQNSLNAEEAFESEFRLKRIDGVYRWQFCRAVAVKDNHGRIERWHGCLTDIDDRRRAEEGLRESEQRFRGAFDAASIGMALVGTDGRWLMVNHSLCALIGYAEAELLATNFQAVTHPDDLDTDLGLLGKTLSGEIFSYDMEKRYLHKLGHIIWIILSVSIVRDANGKPLHFVSLIEDITARKRAEDALREETSLRKAIIECANFSIISTDEQGTIRSFNSTAEAWLGYSSSEVVGQTSPLLIHVAEEVEARAAELSSELCCQIEPGIGVFVAKTLRGGIEEREWTYVRKDRTRFPVHLSISAMRDASGVVTGFLGIAGDLTQRKRDDEDRARLMAILEATTDFITMMDVHGRLLYVNRSVRAAVGLRETDPITDLGIGDFQPDWATRRIFEVAIPCALREEIWTGETSFLRQGIEIPVSQVVIAHRPKNGPVEYLSTIMRDISEHKQMAESLSAARDSAEAAGRAKTDFLANMSHEIRTPMNGIIGMTEVLLDTPLDHDQRDYAETIRNSADALLTIINDILDLSTIDAGKMTMEAIDLNLRTIIEEVTDLLAPGAHRKGLEIYCWIPPNFPAALIGDPIRIRQVLTNFAGNAVKFTESGEVVLSAEVTKLARDRVTVRLSVRDTGIGIPQDKQEAVFETFTQADASTNRRFGGTGLGLAICRQLAQLMGGVVGLISAPGKGSLIWIDLTLRIAPDALLNSVRSAAPSGLEGLRVLIADKEITSRKIISGYLQAWGCLVQGVNSASEVIEVVEAQISSQPFDLIFLDRAMIELDGEPTASLIKTKRPPSPALVLLRSTQSRGTEITGTTEWFDATLTKPVRMAQLRQAVARAIPGEAAKDFLIPRREATSDPMESKTFRVLVAEDQEVNRKVALRLIEKLGVSVDVVNDGGNAIEAFARGGYDLIFMDVQMPGRDGLEATAEIRRLEMAAGSPRIPIFALTAHAMDGERRRCLDAGMDGYVTKPFKQKDLASVIEQVAMKRQEKRPKKPTPMQGTLLRASRLVEVCDGDVPFAHEVLRQFVVSASVTIERLQTAIDDTNLNRLTESAHALRGVCLTVGASDLADSLFAVEKAGTNQHPDEARRALKLTLERWESTRNEIERLVATCDG